MSQRQSRLNEKNIAIEHFHLHFKTMFYIQMHRFFAIYRTKYLIGLKQRIISEIMIKFRYIFQMSYKIWTVTRIPDHERF